MLTDEHLDQLFHNHGKPLDEVKPVLKVTREKETLLIFSSENLFEAQALYDDGNGKVEQTTIEMGQFFNNPEYDLKDDVPDYTMDTFIEAARAGKKHEITTDPADLSQTDYTLKDKIQRNTIDITPRRQPTVSRRTCRKFNP